MHCVRRTVSEPPGYIFGASHARPNRTPHIQVYEVDEQDLVHQPELDWDRTSDDQRDFYVAFQMLLMVAYRTTKSEVITIDDDEIIEVLGVGFGPDVADDYRGGGVLLAFVHVLASMSLLRIEPDPSLSSGRRIVLYLNPVKGEKGWKPDVPEL